MDAQTELHHLLRHREHGRLGPRERATAESDTDGPRAIVGAPAESGHVLQSHAGGGCRTEDLEDAEVPGDPAPSEALSAGAEATSSVTRTVSTAMPSPTSRSSAMSKFMTSPL